MSAGTNGRLKLVAADAEDLEILSARLQDAVGKLKDAAWLPKQRRFVVLLNRFRWEDSKGPGTRVRAALRLDGVSKVQSANVKQRRAGGRVVVAAGDQIHAQRRSRSGRRDRTGAGRRRHDPVDRGMHRRGTWSDQTGPWAARARPSHEDDRR